jgi:hypothetical protein
MHLYILLPWLPTLVEKSSIKPSGSTLFFFFFFFFFFFSLFFPCVALAGENLSCLR